MDHGKTRSDLCASGQQVRALEWEQVDPTAVLGHGIEPCQYYIRYEVGSWWMHGDAEVEDAQEFDDLEAAKAAAQVDYERRILAALTPAPQPEGDHRSFPEAADGRPMPPMGDDLMIAGLNGEDARFVALQLAQNGLMLVSATPTAQEAVPTCFACEDNPKRPNIPCAVCGAHPPQPSETVAEAALTDLRYLANELSWDRRTRDISDRIIAALRALKGEA